MNFILNEIRKIGIVPVVKLDNEELAEPLAQALIDGGINCAEITFRTSNADVIIKRMINKFPDMIVGAGTVLNLNQVDKAMEAGAKFIVSPGFNPKTVEYCKNLGVTIVPGCTTASEIELAIELGLDTVKFFPAEQSGGLEKIKALSAPFPQISFMPTGGINEENICKYLKFKGVIACGGSFMVTSDLVEGRQWDKITEICMKTVKSINLLRSEEEK